MESQNREQYLSSIAEIQNRIRQHELDSATKYITIKKDKMYGKDTIDDSTLLQSEVRFEDSQRSNKPYIPFDGTPFIIIGRKRLACHHGKDTHYKEKERNKTKDVEGRDHDYVVRFPDFKVKEDAKRSEKDQRSIAIKQMLHQKKPLKMEHAFFISIPKNEEHQNHVMGEDASLIQPIDNELKKYISLMVSHHQVSNTFHMKLLLEVYVKQVLFANKSIPSKLNKRFWPSVKDIRNHMALSLLRLRNTNVDQAIESEMVEEWRKQYSNDKFLIRTKEIVEEENNIDLPACPDEEDDSTGEVYLDDETLKSVNVTDKKFLFVHQTDFQRRLLLRYGQEICLMDATYRTTQYALPLYFICVPTNVNYMTVATFITETEDSQSLIEVLQELRKWNPEWSPSFFMCDYATEEINAIESVFPDSFVYLCDFHREQSWERWINASHNGVQHFKSQILALLRKLALASSQEEFEEAMEKLKGSVVWKDNKNLRGWFERHWLSKTERWVRAFRQNRFNVSINTNNGIERQNMALKYEFLQSKKATSLSSLLNIIIENFNFSAYRKYRQLNVQASDQTRKYSSNIPGFLINRPPDFVKHSFTRWQEAENIPLSDIDIVDGYSGEFLVRSQTGENTALHYLVQFVRNEIGLPSCSCKDWQQTHLLCKHFFAVFRHFDHWGWDQLPLAYKSSPFLCLDIPNMECQQQQVEPHSEIYICNQDITTDETENGDNFIELPVTSAASLKRTKQKVNSLCEIIKDLSHKAKDISVLDSAIASLNSVIDSIKSSLPQTDDFLLDGADMLHIGTTKPRSTARKPVPLKKLKPKKRAAGRVGIKANRQKEANSALKDMMNNNEEPSNSTSNGIEEVLEEIIAETDDGRTLREDHTDSQSSEKEEEMVLNHQVIEINDVINKFKEYLKKECSKKNLIEEARRTSKFLRDMTARIGDAVLHQSTDATEFLLILTAEIVDDIPATIKCRMVYIILSHLVESGLISLPSEIDPRLQQERLDQLMKELLQDANGLNQTTENDIASNVDNNSIPSEPPQKKKKRVHFNLTTSTAPSKQLSEHVYPSGGLLNRGKSNMCFANSLLQCLRVTDVHRILQNHKCQEVCVTCTFKDFIEEGPVTAEPLLRQLNGIWPEYRYGVQQDVHEFYNKLMQEIHNKCLRATDKNTADSIFHGVQTSTVTCANCGFKSTRQEIYSDISVAIDGVQSTSEAVNRFFTPVEIEYECQLCKDKNKQATLATTLDSIPKNIVIHLKRFDGGFRKNRKKVDLDHKLNLRRFVSEGKVLEDKAELFAVIFHYGKSCKSGHYYCFIKFGQHWFQIDDMKVKSVTELALKNSVEQEYLLFFKTLPRPYIT